jgi:hypothetical protein
MAKKWCEDMDESLMKKFTRAEQDKIARLCAVQRSLHEGEPGGDMVMRLRRLPDNESSGIEGDPRWELDLPTTGTTYFGHTLQEAFKNAIVGLLADYDEEMEKAGSAARTP